MVLSVTTLYTSRKKSTPQKAKGTKKDIEEASECVRPERVNKWSNSLIATCS
jgi:hypothetical protein